MSATIDTWTGRLGLLAGFCVVAAWLALTGAPGDASAPTASLRIGALANGELSLSPLEKPVLNTDGLRAGGEATTATLRVRNVTPSRLSFALRTSASKPELNRSAWIQISDDGHKLLSAPLGRTHAWTGKNLELASGETRELEVRAWIPKDAPDGWQAARGDVTLEFASHPGSVK